MVKALVFLITSLVILAVDAELVALVQLFRHGQRTPAFFYNNDRYKDLSYWGGLDYGQLTNVGKRQHFELGEFTRNRYFNFIPTKYNRSFFYAQTTDVDRTHMSAQSNIYGIYPAKTGDQIWLKNLDWQAIPVHPANNDIWSSSVFPVSCTKFVSYMTDVLNSEEYAKFDEDYSELYKYLSQNSGNNIKSFIETGVIHDPLKIEKQVGFSVPSWTKSVYPEPLATFTGMSFELATHTDAMKRIVLGPFLNELVTYLEAVVEDPHHNPKFKMYSGHDTNIASVLNVFGAFDPPFPPEFAASIYIELHYQSFRYLVKTYFKNGNNFTEINVNRCGTECTLENFRKSLSKYIIDLATREEECKVDTTSPSPSLFLASPKRFTEEYVEETFKDWCT